KMDVPAEQLAQLKIESAMELLLNPEEYGVTFTYEGNEKINDKIKNPENILKNIDNNFDVNNFKKVIYLVEGSVKAYNFKNKNLFAECNEENYIKQYSTIIQFLTNLGYEQYEISNFALPNYQSLHNSNYWNNTQYLGIGPSAHSFNGKERRWNVSSNIKYFNMLTSNVQYYEQEILTHKDLFNELLLKSLRTSKGLKQESIIETNPLYYKKIETTLQNFIKSEHIIYKNNTFTLSQKGLIISDYIISQLFV
ncbi:MAG: hypothetical protein SNJ71_05880, partial [Bacteroidales bacterium]